MGEEASVISIFSELLGSTPQSGAAPDDDGQGTGVDLSSNPQNHDLASLVRASERADHEEHDKVRKCCADRSVEIIQSLLKSESACVRSSEDNDATGDTGSRASLRRLGWTNMRR